LSLQGVSLNEDFWPLVVEGEDFAMGVHFTEQNRRLQPPGDKKTI